MLQIKQSDLENIFKTYNRVVLFGAGSITNALFEAYRELAIEEKIDYIIDNDPTKDGKTIQANGKDIRLISIERFSRLDYRDYALLIVPVFMLDIVKQIDRCETFDNVPTYIHALLLNKSAGEKLTFRYTKEMKIPKIIHYCWFGKNPLPDTYKKNIESWRKYCPDYEIVEWNENNYDVKKNRFMRQAYEKKQWEFVSDYARKDIVYQRGGVYFDTDVEIRSPIDELLYNEFFIGCDDIGNIASGAGFGAVKGNEFVKALRDDYDHHTFIDSEGKVTGKVCGIYETAFLVRYGYKPNNRFQRLFDGSVVLPREVLCPISWIGMPDMYTDNTLTVHKYDDLLIDKSRKEEYEDLLKRANKNVLVG